MTSALDLVCGPAGPLPDSWQRYRLLEHLGSGGQAEVYRGVRLSAGVRSSPVTIKVFRPDRRYPLDDQLRFWDKGDAVLMDLNSRGVSGICLRVDGFSGQPPRPATQAVGDGEQVPFQILDFLPGHTLVDRLRADKQHGKVTVDAPSILNGLAATLRQLHRPDDDDTPVVHMDVKPANILVLPGGQARLIDFTASRYFDRAHLTTVAYSIASGGPEAQFGANELGPAYDVHGFGSVAYYLITGWHPRAERRTPPLPGALHPLTELRRHPMLEHWPMLSEHLLAPLSERPGDRPRTDELAAWVSRLTDLAAPLPVGQRLARWGEEVDEQTQLAPAFALPSSAARIFGGVDATAKVDGAAVSAPPARGFTDPAPDRNAGVDRVSADPTAKIDRVPAGPTSRLDRAPDRTRLDRQPSTMDRTTVAPPHEAFRDPRAGHGATRPVSGSPDRGGERPPERPGLLVGSARVPDRHHEPVYAPDPPPAPRQSRKRDTRHPSGPVRSRAKGWVTLTLTWFIFCWLIWLATSLIELHSATDPFLGIVIAGIAAIGVYWLTRLGEHMLRSTLERGPRRSTLFPNLTTGLFLLLCGGAFLSRTPLALDPLWDLIVKGFEQA